MANLTIIVGMAGSGKSYLCDKIAKEDKATAFKDATLINDNNHKRAGHDSLGELVARLLGPHPKDCVMDEAHLVNGDFRKEFKNFCDTFLGSVEQKWIFFEKNVVACINNLHHDWENDRGKEVSRLTSLLNQINEYKVPTTGEFPGHIGPRKVFRQPSPQFKDCDEGAALSWVRAKIEEAKRPPHSE